MVFWEMLQWHKAEKKFPWEVSIIAIFPFPSRISHYLVAKEWPGTDVDLFRLRLRSLFPSGHERACHLRRRWDSEETTLDRQAQISMGRRHRQPYGRDVGPGAQRAALDDRGRRSARGALCG
jgi:hypothetical protein